MILIDVVIGRLDSSGYTLLFTYSMNNDADNIRLHTFLRELCASVAKR